MTYTPGGFQVRLDNRFQPGASRNEFIGLILTFGFFVSISLAPFSLPMGLISLLVTAVLVAAVALRKAKPSHLLLEVDGATLTFQAVDRSLRSLATHDVVRVVVDEEGPAIIVHTRTGSPLVLPCNTITPEERAKLRTLLGQVERAQRQRDRDFRMDTERQRLSEMAVRADREPK